jgi:hypothetical protein
LVRATRFLAVLQLTVASAQTSTMGSLPEARCNALPLFLDGNVAENEYLLLSLDMLLKTDTPPGDTANSEDPLANFVHGAFSAGEGLVFDGLLPDEVSFLVERMRHDMGATSRGRGNCDGPTAPDTISSDTGFTVDDEERRSVLCSKNAVFSLWRQETSNSLLVFEPCESASGAKQSRCLRLRAALHSVLQCQRMVPRFRTLIKFMKTFAVYEMDLEGVSWETLLCLSHASESELRASMSEIGIIFDPVSSKYWILDPRGRERLLEHLLDTILVHRLPVTNVSRPLLETALLEMDIIDGNLAAFAIARWFRPNPQTPDMLDLHISDVVRDLVPCLLRRQRNASMDLNELMEQIQRRLPSDTSFDTEHALQSLHGVAIMLPSLERFRNSSKSSPAPEHLVSSEQSSLLSGPATLLPSCPSASMRVQLLEADALPQKPETRLAMLFGLKKQWTRTELDPYIADIPESDLQRFLRPVRGPFGALDQLQRFEWRGLGKPSETSVPHRK